MNFYLRKKWKFRIFVILLFANIFGVTYAESYTFPLKGNDWKVRLDSEGHKDKHLCAIDLNSGTKKEVYAIASGHVVAMESSKDATFNLNPKKGECNDNVGDWGNYVKVCEKYSNSICTGMTHVYGHLSSVSTKLEKGAFISGGTQLGMMGNTGCSTGEHLHLSFYETKRDNGIVTEIPYTVPFSEKYMKVFLSETTDVTKIIKYAQEQKCQVVPELNPTDNQFDDIEDSEAINFLCYKGIIKGYGDGSFKPNNNVTRAEISKMIVKSGVELFEITYPTVVETVEYGDVDSTVWGDLYEPIMTLSKAGMISGYGNNTFGPNNSVTLGELGKFVMSGLLGLEIEYINVRGWHIDFLECAIEHGILPSNAGEGKNNATRIEVAEAIYNAYDAYKKSQADGLSLNKSTFCPTKKEGESQ